MSTQFNAESLETETGFRNLVTPVPFGHANIYLIKSTTGYILVDSGMPKKDPNSIMRSKPMALTLPASC